MSLLQVKITARPGQSRVEVGGVDVTGMISGVSMEHHALGLVPVVTLFQQTTHGEIEVEGVVQVSRSQDLSSEMESWLGDLDPEELEKAMLDRIGEAGYESTGASCLTVLRAWARGDVP